MNLPLRPALLLSCIIASSLAVSADDFSLKLRVDFGKDLGQNFGTLFEAYSVDGKRVTGGGFTGVYNTRYRSDRYALQFYVRPVDLLKSRVQKQLPRANTDSGVYLYGLGKRLYADGNGRNGATRMWDDRLRQWRPVAAKDRNDFGAVFVRGKELELRNGQLLYDDQLILNRPKEGRYLRPYFASGFLFFYHHYEKTRGVGFNRICAVPWNPYSQKPVVAEEMVQHDTPYVREFPYAYGQLKGKVINCSNIGGVYVFDGKNWKTLVEPDDKVSYQIYSMVNYFDELLMGHYPTGELLVFDGETVKRRKQWPPVLSGVSTRAREAQTTHLYSGELFVGVWPWAEVWQLNSENNQWRSFGRMFSGPPLTDKTIHPLEDVTARRKMVLNELGQRVTSMVPWRDSLVIGTSSKSGQDWPNGIEQDLAPRLKSQYGAIHKLTIPGNLSVPIQWTDQPTEIHFVARATRMEVFQDGKKLGSAKLTAAMQRRLEKLRIRTGNGVFGSFRGAAIKRVDTSK